MRLVLISDSHGNKLGIDKIFQNIEFDYLFFMGDGLGDLGTYINLENVFAVSGNCDFFSSVENERYVELGGKKIFITHGNKYGVKLSLDNLVKRGKDLGVDMVFYGHTHNQKMEIIDNIYFINPGSFYPKNNKESFGLIVNLVGDDISVETLKID